MIDRDRYAPAPDCGALMVAGEPRHAPEGVWQALSAADQSLGTVGTVPPTTAEVPATHALLERLEDHLYGSLYG